VVEVTSVSDETVTFTLSKTDVSVANAIRRIILSEVPSMAIEIVNIEDNTTVLFDEFIAHRMGLLPLGSHHLGDLPTDGGFVEHKDCDCDDGCANCSVEFKLDVTNTEDKIRNVTHFDLVPTNRFRWDSDGQERTDMPKVLPLPLPQLAKMSEDEIKELSEGEKQRLRDIDFIDNAILLTKLKKDQRIAMTVTARKGIPKYHSKFMPVTLGLYNFQPTVELDRKGIDSLDMEDKVAFVDSCPRKVFHLDTRDNVQIGKLRDCHYCDECVTKARELGNRGLVKVGIQQDKFHFRVDCVTSDGPRKPLDVIRAALRVLDYKLQHFLHDAYGMEIAETLPFEPMA